MRREEARASTERAGSGDIEVAADLLGHEVADLGVARNGGAAVVRGVGPPRMFGSLAHKETTVGGQVGEQFSAFHTWMVTSS